jgi:hypothetical protein
VARAVQRLFDSSTNSTESDEKIPVGQVLIKHVSDLTNLTLEEVDELTPNERSFLEKARELLKDICSDVTASSLQDLKPSAINQHLYEKKCAQFHNIKEQNFASLNKICLQMLS